MSDDAPLIATPSQTVGPFFHFGLTARPIHQMAQRAPAGERLRLRVRVTDGDGEPVTDALVELSQSGVFGRMSTDQDGACEFETVRPATGQTRPAAGPAAHINVCLFARGLLRQIHTRIYFEDDPSLEQDPTLALVPEDRRRTLLATRDEQLDRTWVFEIRLQGARETVFFDV